MSLIELLAALTAAQAVLFAAFLMVHTAAAARSRFEEAERVFLKTEKFRTIMRRSLRRAGAIHAVPGVRVHQTKIFDAVGQEFTPGDGRNGRLPGSAAVSFLDLDPIAYCRSPRRTGGAPVREICCPDSTTASRTGNSRWIAAGIDGYIEADAASTGGGNSCQPLLLRVARHPMFGGWSTACSSGGAGPLNRRDAQMLLDRAVVFFRVRESYTIYLSSEGSIRRVPHQNGAPQPVLDGISALQLNLTSRRLEATLSFAGIADPARFSLFAPPVAAGTIVEIVL